jgi:putative phage-type endonuclease
MARLIANTAKMAEHDWLNLRKEGIGGSDAAAVAKASKYASPIMVYMDKLGLYIPEKPERVKMAARMGNELEPIIRKLFVEKVNQEREAEGKQPLKVVHRKAIFAHDQHDWMRTNLDGIVHDPDLGKGVFEAKTAHYMLRDEWDGEDVPNAYYIQVQHNMAVMDMQFAWLAVLIGGNDYRHYFIPRDQEFIDYLLMIEQAFWNNHILQRIPPEMSGNDAEKEMMRDLYPQSEPREGYITTLPTVCIERAERVEALKQLIDQLGQEKTAEENEIKAIMGTTETAFAGSHKITWKTASNGVRAMRIKLDAQNDREKFYAARVKEIDKERKEIEKERKNLEKEAEKARKAAEKERKAAEKAAKEALKAEKAALKAAKQNENAEVLV